MSASRLGRPFWIFLTAVFVNRVGAMLGLFLSLYCVKHRGFSEVQAGQFLSFFGLGAVAGAPAGGWCADRLGRRHSVMLGLLGSATAILLVPLMEGPLHLGLAIALLGFFGDFQRPPNQAAIADLTPPHLRRRAYSVFRIAMNFGFMVGAGVGGRLAARHFTVIFLIDAGTAVAAAVLVLFYVVETRPGFSASASGADGARGPRGRFACFCGLSLLVSLVASQMTTNFPISLARRGVGEQLYGDLIAFNGLLVVATQLPVSWLMQRMSLTRALSLGALLYGCGYGIAAFSVHAVPLFLCIGTLTLGEMIFAPAGAVYTAELAPPALRGRWMGILTMTWGVARALAPAAGAYVLARGGDRTLWLLSPVLGGLAAAGLLLLGRRKG